jgi:hypothetical protein
MTPDPNFTFSEAKRRIADAQAYAAAERLARGTSVRPDGHGPVTAIVASFRKLTAAPRPKPAT